MPTDFPNGLTSYGNPVFGVGGLLPFGGKYFWVDETNGNDGNPGSVDAPFSTLTTALANMRDGMNDVCFISGSVHVSASVAWNLNKAHLIGLCAPLRRGKRARISPTTTLAGTAGFNKLVNVTGSGCIFANFGTLYGFSNTAAALVCWSDTGGRNYYDTVEFLGFGDATGGTGTANLTGARAFVLNTSVGETTWRNCVFGEDTVQRGATNYTLEIAGGAPRCTAINCDFEAYLAAGGSAGSHLLIANGGIDRYLKLENCRLMSDTLGGPAGTAMAQALNVTVAAGGAVILDQTTFVGCTAIQTAPTANVVMNMVASTTTGGLAHVVF